MVLGQTSFYVGCSSKILELFLFGILCKWVVWQYINIIQISIPNTRKSIKFIISNISKLSTYPLLKHVTIKTTKKFYYWKHKINRGKIFVTQKWHEFATDRQYLASKFLKNSKKFDKGFYNLN